MSGDRRRRGRSDAFEVYCQSRMKPSASPFQMNAPQEDGLRSRQDDGLSLGDATSWRKIVQKLCGVETMRKRTHRFREQRLISREIVQRRVIVFRSIEAFAVISNEEALERSEMARRFRRNLDIVKRSGPNRAVGQNHGDTVPIRVVLLHEMERTVRPDNDISRVGGGDNAVLLHLL